MWEFLKRATENIKTKKKTKTQPLSCCSWVTCCDMSLVQNGCGLSRERETHLDIYKNIVKNQMLWFNLSYYELRSSQSFLFQFPFGTTFFYFPLLNINSHFLKHVNWLGPFLNTGTFFFFDPLTPQWWWNVKNKTEREQVFMQKKYILQKLFTQTLLPLISQTHKHAKHNTRRRELAVSLSPIMQCHQQNFQTTKKKKKKAHTLELSTESVCVCVCA